MKKLKGLSILFIAMMLVTTACSGGSNNGGNNAGTNTPANNAGSEGKATNEPVKEEPAKEEPPAAIDLGGRTIKVAAWWDQKPAGNTAGEKARLDKLAELEKQYNFKFEFVNVPFEQYMDKVTTSTLAGEPFADIAIMELKRAIPLVKQGLILPVSEFTSATDDINNEQKLMQKLPAMGGAEYAFGTPGVSIVGTYYNRDLVKKLGLQDPQELYNAGQWTWDKFLELAKAATRDTDNDGKNDTFGYSGWPVDAARHFGVTNNAMFVNEDLTMGMTDPKFAETLEFVNRLYNVENVVKVKTGNKMDYNETNTFKDGDVLMSINYDWNVGDLTFEVGVVPNPSGPSSDGKHTYANTAQNGWFMLKGVKDAKTIYSIWEQSFDVPPTEEYLGQDWLESRFKNQADIDLALKSVNGTGRLAVEEGIPDFPIYAVLDEIILQNQSVSATIEKHKAAAEAAIQKVK
ncbi:ABC transporter substrate-binding protein [Paenibacillus aurantiacus]|uniref:ABC transporter substrate-binding protein n=1 Tax=Paenibacillus aurantiacus TaxID=1936118 RepID=A0ABV5KRV9_9BACL